MKAYPEYKASGIDWLGDIPSHWEMSKYKYHADSRMGITILKEQMVENGLPIYSATQDDSILGYTNNRSLLLHSGDFVIPARGNSIGYVTKVSFDEATCSQTTICSTNFRNICIDYLLFCCKCFKKDWFFFVDTAIPQITGSQVDNNILPLPSVAEQEAIAAYLDEQTGRIDALIEQKQKQVEDIKAYRTSLITETVTRGLNPDAPLRPSGVDWLGDIPEHWITSKLKYIGEARNGLTYSPDDICEQGKGVLVLRSSNIQNEQLCLEDNVYVSKKVDELMMNEGDILICSRNGSASLVGKCAIIPKGINASFGAFMMRYRSIINKRYTLYLVRTTLAQHKAQFATSTINKLTNAMIGNMQEAVPPLAEQQAIADFLDAKTAKIDELIGELTKQIDELTEYKQAVITEAVTGKVDVRDWKPKD